MVKQQGYRCRDRHIILNAKHNSLDHPRLGMIASKKSLPKSVDRNRQRRLVREWFRLRQHSLPSMDIVTIFTYSSNTLTASELFACLDKLIGRAVQHYNGCSRAS